MRGVDLLFTFFFLGLIVACVGTAYRYLTSSIARLYAKNLKQLLGPWAQQFLKSPLTAELRIRGPLQLTNIASPRLLLPPSRDEFIAGFERVAPGLYGQALAALQDEVTPADWDRFLARLTEEDTTNYEAHELLSIVTQNTKKEETTYQARPRIRTAVWKLFPDADNLISRYDEFLAKIGHANQRRDLRQLTVIAGLLTFTGNLTFNRLFESVPLGQGFALFDFHVFQSLPGLLREGHVMRVLTYSGACLLSTLTLAGIADVVDRRILGNRWRPREISGSRRTLNGK